jgi:CDP-diglyceride synthetase
MMIQRTLSSICLLGIVALVSIAPSWVFYGLLAIIALLACIEWSQIIFARFHLTYAVFFVNTIVMYPLFGVVGWLIWSLLATMYIICTYKKQCKKTVVISYISYATALISAQFLYKDHSHLFGITLLAVCATDIMAYFGGRLLKGKKLLPTISPNKTWSGFIIGTTTGTVTWITLYTILIAPKTLQMDYFSVHFLYLVLLGWFISLLAQVGDLTESFFKRRFNQKDSGWLIPGHGGVLDRLDSIMFVMPFVALLAGCGIFNTLMQI